MSDLVEERVSGNLNALLQPLTETLADLELQRSALALQLSEIDRQIRRAKRVLTAAETALGRPPASKPRSGGRANHPHSSAETLERVIKVFTDNPTLTFSVGEIAERTGLHKSTIQYAVKDLRGEQRIRLLGRRTKPADQIGPPENHYRLMPEELNGDE